MIIYARATWNILEQEGVESSYYMSDDRGTFMFRVLGEDTHRFVNQRPTTEQKFWEVA